MDKGSVGTLRGMPHVSSVVEEPRSSLLRFLHMSLDRVARACLGLGIASALVLAPPVIAQTYGEPPFLAERVAKGELPPVAERVPAHAHRGRSRGQEPQARHARRRHRQPRRPGARHPLHVAPTPMRASSATTRRSSCGPTSSSGSTRARRASSPSSCARATAGRTGSRSRARISATSGRTSRTTRSSARPGRRNSCSSTASRPQVEVLDARTIRYSWDKPNPRFLPTLAQPRDPFIYRPAHYLKRFHAKYADKAALEEAAKEQKLKSWAALHNRLDDMNEQTNPDLPTLQAWRVTNAAPASRFIFERNPFYHRVDARRAATALCRPDRARRRGRRPHGRQGQCRRDRPSRSAA